MDAWAIPLVVVLAMGFTFTNGFHDASNAVATSITTRSLTPRVALGLAALMNLLGGLIGGPVAETVGGDLITVPIGAAGVAICASALVGAIAWNLITWYRGMPSSSTHALIGGMGGAALALSGQVQWGAMATRVLAPMVLSPIVGLVLGYLLMALILRALRNARVGPAHRAFRYAQTVSAAAVAFGHGMQDAAKAAGLIILALVAADQADSAAEVPAWVLGLSAVVLAVGTLGGGWRIIRTLGGRIVRINAPEGFAAEATAAGVLYAATALGTPISTTQTLTSALVGAGSTRGAKAVRWDVARAIAFTWLVTVPGAALIAALCAALWGVVWG